jgi:hypothetical protein
LKSTGWKINGGEKNMDWNFCELLEILKSRAIDALKDGSQGNPVSTRRSGDRKILEAINAMRIEQGFEALPINL